MLAADLPYLEESALREGRLAFNERARQKGDLRFVQRRPPAPSYVSTVMPFGVARDHGAIVVLFQAFARCRPTVTQQAFLGQLERLYLARLAAALVLLRPAFRRYIGEQSVARRLDHEFIPTCAYVPEDCAKLTVPLRWELLLRCVTDPTFEFLVRFQGSAARQLLVDRTEIAVNA